jgi:UDP-glucose 4-epimerase
MDVRSKYTEVMVKWLDRIDRGEPLLVFGDGSDSADYVYVADVARANLAAAQCDASDAIVNVCTGVETPLRTLAEALLRLTGSAVGVEHRPQTEGALPARRYGDPARARELLGFEARTGLEEGLRRLIAWRKEALASVA